MNRYQKPELYEQLAMEYSLGTLEGGARKRFERLMGEHPYLAAIVEDNDQKFAPLISFLPETKPEAHVWDNISELIDSSELSSVSNGANSQGAYDTFITDTASQGSWWQFFTNKGFTAAMMLLAVTAIFMLKPWTGVEDQQAQIYAATLISKTTQKPMVDVLVNKSDLLLTIKLNERVNVPDNMRVVFWCIAKDKTTPIMNMGTVASYGLTTKKLDEQGWQGIVDASEFAVSIEPVDAMTNSSPSGDLIFVGKLEALTKT